MCWSVEASATLATVGLASTAFVAYKGEDKALWIPLAYFSLMEMLQAFTYPVIDQCSLPRNQLLTFLGFLHIAFQPFFINMVGMHFIPEQVKKKISTYVYGLCFTGSVVFLIMLYPFPWAGNCVVGCAPICGDRLCSVSGNWHIAWELPLNGMKWAYLGYFLPTFILPIIYGSWRANFYHILLGPLLAWTLTDNINEWPAIWCLLSIGLLLLLIKSPIRRCMYINTWFLWRKSN